MCSEVKFTPTCTVVISTRDRLECLQRCLEGLANQCYAPFAVVVVDSAPTHARADQVAAQAGAHYLLEPVPGLSRARNRGTRSCSAEIIAFIDDDAVPEPTWLCHLISEFRDPEVVAVTGRILSFHPSQTEELARFANDLGPDRRVVSQRDPNWFEIVSFGGIGRGGSMAFRRSAFDQWPGFDERLGRGAALHGGEEQKAFLWIVEAGYSVVYNPESIVYHPLPRDLEELKERYLKGLSASTAFMTLLFMETRHRRDVLRYAFQGVWGIRRGWRRYPQASEADYVPLWQSVFAFLSGPLKYLRTKLPSA